MPFNGFECHGHRQFDRVLRFDESRARVVSPFVATERRARPRETGRPRRACRVPGGRPFVVCEVAVCTRDFVIEIHSC